MNTKSQVPSRILFAEESFSNAIENKNVEVVANFIREACHDYEFEGRFDTPICEILSTEAPERLKDYRMKVSEQFETNTYKLAKIIVDSGFAPFSENDMDIMPLLSAIRDQSEDVARYYYWIGGPIDKKHRYDHIEFEGLSDDEVDFFKLARKGDADAMCKMIVKGVNAHAKTEDHTTALMVAVEYEQHDAAEKLLHWKVDINAREMVDAESAGEGVTAMNLAALNKDYQMLDLLLKHGGEINEKAGFDGESPFLVAVCSGDYDFMDFILKHGADVDNELYDGKTALIHAVLSNDQKLATYLIENGSDLNHRNITGLTALEVAKAHGLTDMANFLIKSGANDEDRMLEHLVTYRQDFYVWDNDVAYAYYHWTTTDGFSHFLIYGIGYLNKYLALSELRRFYIRKKEEECIETYAGDDHRWFHYTRSENGKMVDERFNGFGRNLKAWGDLIFGPDKLYVSPKSAYLFEPAQRKEFDFEGKFQKLSEFFRQYVSIVKGRH